MREQLALLPTLLTAHVQLVLAALAAGVTIAVPAGVLVTRVKSLEGPVLAAASLIQTIPALALLAGMVPLLAALGFPGIGWLPAFLGLVLYSLLPILRNTVTGLAELDAEVIEAARGVGMTPAQQLRLVELPLALPVIIAGVRTAAVWTVGMATLSTPVGAPSLGNYIFSGLQTRNFDAVIVGCASAAALALVLDGLVRTVARGYERRRPGLRILGGSGLLAMSLWAIAALPGWDTPARPVRIGAKTFTEQYVLAEILSAQVRSATGAPVEVVSSLGSTVAFDALARGEIDAYVDYTGTIWATLLKRRGAGASRREVLEEVRRWLAENHGIRLVASLGFENTYAFAMRREQAEALGVRRLSDLVPHARGLRAGGDYEIWSRGEWRAVREAYGLDFAERRSMDPSLMYAAIAARQVDVITAYSSDGRIEVHDLVILEDDRGAIPPYDAVVLASRALARERPEIVAALEALDGTIEVGRMRELNRAVDEGGRAPTAVGGEFVRRLGSAGRR